MTAIIQPGNGQHSVTLGKSTLDVFTWHPKAKPKLLLVVFHGMHADADNYRDRTRPLAELLGAAVVAPKFAQPEFTQPLYQRGGVAPEGQFVPPGRRTVDLIAPLVAWAQRACGQPGLRYALIGHSAGGQFLSRVAAFAPAVGPRYVIANPSTWVLPSLSEAVPYGLGGSPHAEQTLRNYLALPITVLLGREDTGTENLSSEPEAVAQGVNRLERGRNTFAKAKAAAKALGGRFNWTLAEVPGVGHDSAGMFASKQAYEALR
jgi:alpha-beta hydrolase superfamily lysophospholipase